MNADELREAKLALSEALKNLRETGDEHNQLLRELIEIVCKYADIRNKHLAAIIDTRLARERVVQARRNYDHSQI